MAQVLKEEVRNRILEAAEKVFYKKFILKTNWIVLKYIKDKLSKTKKIIFQ